MKGGAYRAQTRASDVSVGRVGRACWVVTIELRILLELPDLLRVSTAAISRGPCRLSVYRMRGTDFELASLHVCDSPIDLARDGGDGGAEVVVEDRGR